MFIGQNWREIRILGKNWSDYFFLFARLWIEPEARFIILQNKEETNIFPCIRDRTS